MFVYFKLGAFSLWPYASVQGRENFCYLFHAWSYLIVNWTEVVNIVAQVDKSIKAFFPSMQMDNSV